MINYQDAQVTLYQGDALTVLGSLDADSVQCVVTSPPYWGLRDYGTEGQVGLEPTPEEWTDRLVAIFAEVRRVLRDDGTVWLNIGDMYFSIGGQRTYGSSDGGVGRAQQAARRSAVHWKAGGGTNFSYVGRGGQKAKDLVGLPWMLAFALRADGWYLRSEVIWSKPNPMPESVTDRPTKAHEQVFLLSKSSRYCYDADAIKEPWTSGRDDMREKGVRTGLAYLQQAEVSSNDTKVMPKRSKKPDGWDTGEGGHGTIHRNGREVGAPAVIDTSRGRNKRSVWEIATAPYPDAHFATFPPDLIKPCILAGCPEGGVVLDPFVGSGTTALVAKELGRKAIGIDLNPAYLELARKRLRQETIWGIPA